jgi:phytoene dehydrogenase-like protein
MIPRVWPNSLPLSSPLTPDTLGRQNRAASGPTTGLDNVWLVGDPVFPGQSTAGVTVGGMRVAAEVLRGNGL